MYGDLLAFKYQSVGHPEDVVRLDEIFRRYVEINGTVDGFEEYVNSGFRNDYTEIKNTYYYLDKYLRSLKRIEKEVKEGKYENNISLSEIFDEIADAEEIAGFYIYNEEENALKAWNMNTAHITEPTEQDKEVSRILSTLFAENKKMSVFENVYSYLTEGGHSGIVRADSEKDARERVKDFYSDDEVRSIVCLNELDSDYGVVENGFIEQNLKDRRPVNQYSFIVDGEIDPNEVARLIERANVKVIMSKWTYDDYMHGRKEMTIC